MDVQECVSSSKCLRYNLGILNFLPSGKGLKEAEEEMDIVVRVYDYLGQAPVTLQPLDKFKQLCAAFPARLLGKKNYLGIPNKKPIFLSHSRPPHYLQG